MNRAIVVLLVLLVPMLPAATAQIQPPSWELGWATDMDTTYRVDLDDDWDVNGELVVFVNNERSNELNLQLTYDYDDTAPFEFDGPDSIAVPASTNDTFTITISGGDAEDVRAFSPSSKVELIIVAEERIGEATVSNQEIDGDIGVPRVYMLTPELTPPSNTLFAGSWVEFDLTVFNYGNTQDAITVGQATVRSCPHLSVLGLDEVEDVIVPVTASNGEGVMFTLRLEATSSHQERTCEVTVSIGSEGDAGSRSDTLDVAVVAPEADEDVPVPDDGGSDEELGQPVDSNPLPWLGAGELAFVLLATMVWRPRRD